MRKNNIVTSLDKFKQLNESRKSFFDTTDDEFITKYNKIDDLKIRELKPKKGDWVNFKSEYGDVWHLIIKTYEPVDYYGSVYYYDPIDSKSTDVKQLFTYYYNIRKISSELPEDAREIFSDTGAFSERRGNLSQYHR